jgi:hypothetical protein
VLIGVCCRSLPAWRHPTKTAGRTAGLAESAGRAPDPSDAVRSLAAVQAAGAL